ncbi:MAG: DinB family protein [Bacteroidetes bacterium]|nr:DinB family protein [Bacteroidota bacterium]
MNLTVQIAKHFREVHFGGNWTAVNLKTELADVNWKLATTKIYSFNTIAALVFHINYYVEAISKVLVGVPLTAKDQYSFNVPPIESQEDWEKLLNKTWADAQKFVELVEQLQEAKLDEIFVHEKYGTYYRNLHGVTEHAHYHLGQIVLIKKILLKSADMNTL